MKVPKKQIDDTKEKILNKQGAVQVTNMKDRKTLTNKKTLTKINATKTV